MKKILVPTDFSKIATNALDEAVNIAKKTSADIVLLHVIEEGSSESMNVTADYTTDDPQEQIFMLKLIKKSLSKLDEIIANPAYAGISFYTELRLGNAFHGITNIIDAHQVDLVVMGTTGSSGIQELLVGSNAEKVVRHAKCPVLTINDKADTSSYEHIVLATGMLEKETELVTMVKGIQKQYGSQIHLLWINTPNNFERDKHTKNGLKDFASKHDLSNYTINIYNDVTEEEGIVCFAADMNADMIAMVTHRRTGIAHLIAGSIAEDVVNHSKRPVLTSGID
jgi:nucleotide-binding universal stress UspA family protein